MSASSCHRTRGF